MDYYFSTSYFTLIPDSVFIPDNKDGYLNSLFNIEDENISDYIKLERTPAYMVYSVPNVLKEWQKENINIFPLALYFYRKIQDMQSHNKVILSIDKRHKITHIIVAQGDDLKLINTYNTGDFSSALYYLFLALKMLQINPALTHIRMYNTIDDKKMELLKNYFNTIEVYSPECNILSIR